MTRDWHRPPRPWSDPSHNTQVKTTNASSYNEGKGKFFVMSPNTRRTFTDHGGAIDHATNLIRVGNSDEFLIVKVVGRVRKKPIPVEYIEE
jgi:hypothetical protein